MARPTPGVEAVRVVHRDAHLLVLIKPPHLPTTAPDEGPCLVKLARELDPEAPRLHPSSRLDAEVTGVVTFARTRRATKALLEARKAGLYRRLYLGLASPGPTPDAGRWDASIALDPRDPRRRRAGDGEGARQAATRFEVAERRPLVEGELALLRLFPETGRTHQLRVHAAAASAPLFGDAPYGGPKRLTLASGRVVSARRVMLHCAEVRVPRIAGDGEHLFRARVPADFEKAWAAAGGTPIAELSAAAADERR
ncbi:MAG TPA: pseudouridine synthase [Polyangiaceae bacterium LLY-WYZ-15_(1-7)]|nr:RNA pseudouridine synthase [Sandaracinus sp.]HJL01351.1 pseudouridine synthase [Polyangiaceae bacterium LLY-WYZ-15_(1-7)]MBJ72140.1 RNA pseudouridine synthase [Sandaracinus sp.]HJL09505.1 pseudouridine synthase [Polyangiaceae bacterium LLY-WYZ-15_(1-7)]HJL25587.1 pseudouridine synthase [Polyangiaceae bacterium LLY-WYZ-15_(1-7)]